MPAYDAHLITKPAHQISYQILDAIRQIIFRSTVSLSRSLVEAMTHIACFQFELPTISLSPLLPVFE
jgi:hypothetical protein